MAESGKEKVAEGEPGSDEVGIVEGNGRQNDQEE
jgi:hypothetical protein